MSNSDSFADEPLTASMLSSPIAHGALHAGASYRIAIQRIMSIGVPRRGGPIGSTPQGVFPPQEWLRQRLTCHRPKESLSWDPGATKGSFFATRPGGRQLSNAPETIVAAPSVLYRATADLVLITHLLFVLFVLCGALLTLWRPRVWIAHLAALIWGAFVEFTGTICPLTPLETKLRELGGGPGYRGDFIAHYVLATLYPAGLTRGIQIGLGGAVLLINAMLYIYIFRRRRKP